MSEANFESDTRVRRVEGGWEADLHPGWNVGNNPNGGYLLAVATRAMAAEAAATRGSGLDPLTVTGHYLSPPAPGSVVIRTEVVKPGRSFVTVMAQVVQGERERVRVLGAFGDLGDRRGPTRVSARAPEIPPPDECIGLRELTERAGRAVPEVMNRFDLRLPADSPWGRPGEGDPFEITGWIRLRDGTPPSVISAVAFADAFPPTLLGAVDAGWVPTIEMTVHVRGRPPRSGKSGEQSWLIGTFRTRVLVDGLMEEDGELWDADGRPVALSRQLALVLAR